MTIEEVIDNLDPNDIEKSRLLICFLRNTDAYHKILKNEGVRLYKYGSYVSFPKIVDCILKSNEEILIKYTILSIKSYKTRILEYLNL